MNQFLLIVIVLAVCGGAYMRTEQPQNWNQFLDVLRAPATSGATVAPAVAETSGPSGTSGDSTAPSTAIAPKPAAPEYVNPAPGTPIHSSHIVDVAQPSQTNHETKSFSLPSQPAWVWTTSDGRTFRNVVIQKVEADRVTISSDEGAAVVDISVLPTEIQTQLNYDPTQAAQASAARSAAAAAAPPPANP